MFPRIREIIWEDEEAYSDNMLTHLGLTRDSNTIWLDARSALQFHWMLVISENHRSLSREDIQLFLE